LVWFLGFVGVLVVTVGVGLPIVNTFYSEYALSLVGIAGTLLVAGGDGPRSVPVVWRIVTMCPVPRAAEEREWAPLTVVADQVGLTPYSLMKSAMAGHVRCRLTLGFPTLFHREDAARLMQSLYGGGS